MASRTKVKEIFQSRLVRTHSYLPRYHPRVSLLLDTTNIHCLSQCQRVQRGTEDHFNNQRVFFFFSRKSNARIKELGAESTDLY